MAKETNNPGIRGFVPSVLPWVIGGVAFIVYVGTLNHWVTLYSLGTLARVSGWTPEPEVLYPLTAIVLWPFALLPESWVPLALNLFTATCAALVLVVLARTIALLTQPPAQASGTPQVTQAATLSVRTAWMAPVLAALACGLQSTFWEHATSATGETMDLLLFAYIIRCLLEFRNDRKESWLARSAFLYGAGLTDNWALWLYLPLFVTAVIRLRCIRRLEIGYAIGNLRSLLRLALWGLAGLSLYLLLPALASLSSVRHMGFWPALKTNLKFEKDAVQFFLDARRLGLLALATYLPLLAISFRWDFGPSKSAKDNPSLWITHATIHVVHAVLLFASLWLMLDPPFSPRALGFGVQPVGQYYVSALVAGYCVGYFLLIGAQLIEGSSDSYVPGHGRSGKRLGKLAVPAMFALLVGMPVALVARNLSQIRVTNGPAIREFASQLCDALPSGKSVMLSDDKIELYLVCAEQSARGHSKATLPLNTQFLGLQQYQNFVAHRYKERWPLAADTNSPAQPRAPSSTALLSILSTNEPLVYLHPGLDSCFDQFAGRPSGPVQLLLQRPAEEVIGQKLDGKVAATNELYWQQQWKVSLQTLAQQMGEHPGQPPPWAALPFKALYLKPEPNRTASYLGAAYARSLDYWGVQMQRLGHWADARLWFQRALELNAGNLSARINLEYNQAHQRGDTSRLKREAIEAQFADVFADYRPWEWAAKNGPVDEPTFLSAVAALLWEERNYHQAADAFLRCTELAPDWAEPQLGLLESYVLLRDFAHALPLAEKLSAAHLALTAIDEARLMSCRAKVLYGLNRREDARSCIKSFARQHSEQPQIVSAAIPLFLEFESYVDAENLADQLLHQDPNNTGFLECKGLAQKEQLLKDDDAIATFTRVLELDPANPAARINRASTYLHAKRLGEAQADYQYLLKDFPTTHQVLYGLAEIAAQKNDAKTAIEFYQRYLASGNPDSLEYRRVAESLRHLQSR